VVFVVALSLLVTNNFDLFRLFVTGYTPGTCSLKIWKADCHIQEIFEYAK